MLELPQVVYESLLRSIQPCDAFMRQFVARGTVE